VAEQAYVELLHSDPVLDWRYPAGEARHRSGKATTARPEHLRTRPSEETRSALGLVLLGWAERKLGGRRREVLTLDLDSLPTVAHRHEPGRGHNGHLPRALGVDEAGHLSCVFAAIRVMKGRSPPTVAVMTLPRGLR
jgi:hypothetical protein